MPWLPLKRLHLAFLIMLIAIVALTACRAPTEEPASIAELTFEPVAIDPAQIPDVSWELRISGAVAAPAVLAYRDLAEHELVRLGDILEECYCGDESLNIWEGIALGVLLAEAGASEDATGVVFRGADGYWRRADLGDVSWAIVAMRRDGDWLVDDPQGPVRMVVPEQSASYWISQLVEIEVVE